MSVRHSRKILSEMYQLHRIDQIFAFLYLREVEMYSEFKNAIVRSTQTDLTNVS